MISIIHPSRSRAEKSVETMERWIINSSHESSIEFNTNIEVIISLDEDDPTLHLYQQSYSYYREIVLINKNRSCVDAINNAAKISKGDIIIVVSDDTEPIRDWDVFINDYGKNDSDWILKTQDGIQPYIITMPVMDRAYYNRTGYIYHPDFQHLFCDTYMTCVADITGRKITSNLMFKHDHYSVNGTAPDEIHKKNDATWKQGEETFIRLMKQFSREELNRIQDQTMKNWLKMKRVL